MATVEAAAGASPGECRQTQVRAGAVCWLLKSFHQPVNEGGDGFGGVARVEADQEITRQGVGRDVGDFLEPRQLRLQEAFQGLGAVEPVNLKPHPSRHRGMNGLHHGFYKTLLRCFGSFRSFGKGRPL